MLVGGKLRVKCLDFRHLGCVGLTSGYPRKHPCYDGHPHSLTRALGTRRGLPAQLCSQMPSYVSQGQ